MECKDQKFYIPKSDIDLKGNLYPVSAWKELDNKVDIVLDRIKQCGKLQNDDEQKRDTIQEYEELIKDVSAKYQKPFSVFYKIVTNHLAGMLKKPQGDLCILPILTITGHLMLTKIYKSVIISMRENAIKILYQRRIYSNENE
jgi:hypothetical protein